MTQQTMNKILFTGIPKCGTHMLVRYFPKVGFRDGGPFKQIAWHDSFVEFVRNLDPGQFSAWHFHWSQKLSDIVKHNGVKTVFLHRDPRAQISSELHFIMRTPHHRFHDLFTKRLKTDHERMIRLIEGVSVEEWLLCPILGPVPFPSDKERYLASISMQFGQFEPWFREPNCYSVKFEDVVGPKGGGSRERQLQVVEELMAFTGTPNGASDPQSVADVLFSEKTRTFRKGRIDSWREDFTPELHKLFMVEAGDLLERWGYKP